ncbi:MAG: DUF433 domain-containing protein [Gammaproteobacteria bacterium]|nr:DUF433 domain-containing protein [Gammaproteobacteria bacterium]
MHLPGRIVGTPGTCGGRPRIDGTRITVEFLFGLKAAGWSDTQILEGYPHLAAEDLQAAFAYAMSILEDESILPAAHVG